MERAGDHILLSYIETEAARVGLGLNCRSDNNAVDVLTLLTDTATCMRGLVVARMRYVMQREPTPTEIEDRLLTLGTGFVRLPFDGVIHEAIQEAAATLAFFDADSGGEPFVNRSLQEISAGMLSDSYAISADIPESTEQ